MLGTDGGEVAGEVIAERGGEDGDPILAALALADDELQALEVDVLHAQPRALEQPQARAVEQRGHELGCAVELVEECRDLVAGEDDGQPLGALGADEGVEPGRSRSRTSR